MPETWATDVQDRLAACAVLPRPSRPPVPRRGRVISGLANGILAQLPLGIAVLNQEARLLYWNEQAVSLFGMPSQAAGMPLLAETLSVMANLTQHQRDKVVAFVIAQVALGDRAETDTCLRMSLAQKRRVVLQVRGLGAGRWMLMIDDGKLVSPAEQRGAGHGDAWLDALTGLSNRRHFNEVLRELVANGSAETRHAVLIIDLDRFKPINDTLGHAIGDAMLCLVARRLRQETRADDMLVRLGGDEFVLLLADVGKAESLATRIIDVLSRPYLVEGHVANISASIGIALYPDHGTTADDLLQHADLALLDAKTSGKRTWRAFAPAMSAEAHKKRELETDLRKALALGELSVAYQPQFNIENRTLSGFEALLRWKHPVRGHVSPAEFIPVAEDIGCIAALGEWILKTACKEAARWPAPMSVAVNVSPRQMENPERLFQAVKAALQSSGLEPARLELEITESSLLSQDKSVLETLHRLRAIGIRIAMDDFGTGYSSLGQLQSFPFNKIKIDRSFIISLGNDAAAAAVVRAIAALGAGLGMTTTAEGVETPEQAALVAADGCTDIQGYLISRPVPASEIDGLLGKYNPRPEVLVAQP